MGENLTSDQVVQKHINLWIGSEGVCASSHYDTSHNFFFQVYGEKEFLLFPPEDVWRMYLHSSLHPYYRSSQILINQTDTMSQAPLLHHHQGLSVRLQAGDMLYLPPYWFHHVQSMSPSSLSVNVWSNSHDYWVNEGLFAAPIPLEAEWSLEDSLCFLVRYSQELLLRLRVLAGPMEQDMWQYSTTHRLLRDFRCDMIDRFISFVTETMETDRRKEMYHMLMVWLHSRYENSLGAIPPDASILSQEIQPALRSCSASRFLLLDGTARIERGLLHVQVWANEFSTDGVRTINIFNYLESLYAFILPASQVHPLLHILAASYSCSLH